MSMRRLGLIVALGALLALSVALTNARASNEKPLLVHPLLHIAPVTTYVVTKTSDSGDNTNAPVGTLRRAMVDANNHPGFDAIVFDLPGSGVQTITIKNYFPDLTDDAGVMIDGTTGNDRIQLDASQVNSHHAISIISNNNVIRGLIINGTQGGGAAIALTNGASNNLIVGNYLGTNAAGNASRANHSGVYISNGSNNNIIGGTGGVTPGGACTGDCNVLSGNRFHGVVIDHSSGNKVMGNFIGLNAAGNGVVGNGDDGVLLASSPNNVIGGATPPERNVIAGNASIDIEVAEDASHNNLIQGNYIGTNSAGNQRMANGTTGVLVDLGSHDNTVDGNVVSAHNGFGILVFQQSTRTRITNNRVGISAQDDSNLGNGQKGIEVQTNNNSIIGNRVGNNGSDGIRVKMGMNDLISQNTTFNNRTFGINLGTDGFTANDPGDADTGPNGYQNFPDISSALTSNGNLTVSGNLNSRPSARYTLEFFWNPACDVTFGHAVGEGYRYLGSTTVTTDSSNNAGFSVVFNGAPTSGVVTGTATDSANNTSEFSPCRDIASGVPAPTAPQLVSPGNGENVGSNPPTLSWNAAPGAAYYQVILRQDAKRGITIVNKAQTTSTQFTPPKLTSGKTYFWRVLACNSLGQCAKSGFFTFTLPAPAPTAPQLVSPIDSEKVGNNPPTLTWNAAAGAAYYKIILRQDAKNGTTIVNQSNVTTTRFTTPKLTSGKTYFWRVWACNNAAQCASSGFRSFLVP